MTGHVVITGASAGVGRAAACAFAAEGWRVSLLAREPGLLALRREHRALSVGHYLPLKASGDVLAFAREAAPEKFLVALNLGSGTGQLSLPWRTRIVLSTHNDREGDHVESPLLLRGDEGILALVQ